MMFLDIKEKSGKNKKRKPAGTGFQFLFDYIILYIIFFNFSSIFKN